MDLCAFAEVRAETAGAAQPGQLAGARSRDHEPVAADDVVLDGSGVLQQERALASGHGPGDALDPDKAGRPVRARRLQSSSTRNGITFWPTNASLKSSSTFANPVTVLPPTR